VGPAGGENRTEEENEVNRKRRRLTIVLAAVGAIGAIAAIATAASLALFYDPTSPATAVFATGNVALDSATSQTCVANDPAQAPGYESDGDAPTASQYFTQAEPCTLTFTYTGSLDAFLAADIAISSEPEQTPSSPDSTTQEDCNGGSSTYDPQTCAPLYNPSVAGTGGATNNADDGIQINVVGTDSYGGTPQEFGVGNDQTIVDNDGSSGGVDASYSGEGGSCSNETCAVKGSSGLKETFTVYVYWPLDTSSTTEMNQNIYAGATATVTITEHSVQAADNPLNDCSAYTVVDNYPFPNASYYPPDQPYYGWGAGFSSGNGGYPGAGVCPSSDPTGTGADYPAGTSNYDLMPFYHSSN
jgi:hypothetical protein